jgi:hypothetical protein
MILGDTSFKVVVGRWPLLIYSRGASRRALTSSQSKLLGIEEATAGVLSSVPRQSALSARVQAPAAIRRQSLQNDRKGMCRLARPLGVLTILFYRGLIGVSPARTRSSLNSAKTVAVGFHRSLTRDFHRILTHPLCEPEGFTVWISA